MSYTCLIDERPNRSSDLQVCKCDNLSTVGCPTNTSHHLILYLTCPSFKVHLYHTRANVSQVDDRSLVVDAHNERVVWRPFNLLNFTRSLPSVDHSQFFSIINLQKICSIYCIWLTRRSQSFEIAIWSPSWEKAAF